MKTVICVVSIAAISFASPSFAQAPDPRPGPSTPVTVVNTPLPVTGTISIGNLPVPLEVTGTVQVSGTEEPWRFRGACTTAGVCGAGDYTVPTGKRLVIEYVSLAASGQPTGDLAVGLINIRTPSVFTLLAAYQIPPSAIVVNGRSASSQVVRLYVNTGELVNLNGAKLSGSLGPGGEITYNFELTGHLIAVP
jgi:hypothetical protein